MRFVERTGPGRVELNFMWLPTWVGMNTHLVADIDKHLQGLFLSQVLSEELLDKAHREVIAFVVARFPQIDGLFDYLDSIKFVSANGKATEKERGAPAPAGTPATGG